MYVCLFQSFSFEPSEATALLLLLLLSVDTLSVGSERGEVLFLLEVLEDVLGSLWLEDAVVGEVSDVTDDLGSVERMDFLVVSQQEVAQLQPGLSVVVHSVVTNGLLVEQRQRARSHRDLQHQSCNYHLQAGEHEDLTWAAVSTSQRSGRVWSQSCWAELRSSQVRGMAQLRSEPAVMLFW